MRTVRQWLDELGLGEYAEAFEDNQLGLEHLADLSEDDLKELGVSAMGHRKTLLRAIAAIPVVDQITPVSATSQEASKSKAEGERRQITVMFADLAESTALSGRLDPEDMRDAITAYQNAVAGEVVRFGGHVAKYMGDGVLCYFGWPRAHEDDAERAVRAGIAVIEAINRLTAPNGEQLAARIGLATGLVVIGDLIGEGAAQEEAVVGDTPNLAARLQALAAPCQVILGATTRRLIGDLFALEDLGPQELKGIAQPVAAFVVLGETMAESRFAARGGQASAALVGREQERALLQDRWHRAAAGEGQMALLSGEAGIGKSQMAQNFIGTLAGEAHIRVSYQCSPYHTDTALYPAIQQLVFASGIDQSDQSTEKLDKLAALLGQAQEDISTAAALLSDLMGFGETAEERYGKLDLSPQQRRGQILEALFNQLRGLAQESPVLFLVEDIHWVDPTTMELLERIIADLGELPVLMLLTYRSDFDAPWIGREGVTLISLNRLSRRDRAAMIGHIAGDNQLPSEVVDQIVDVTDGVPLFVEELTKSVIESGLLELDGGSAGGGRNPTLAIPETLQDTLMARLDRLSGSRDLLQIGACMGREFSFELLAEVTGEKDDVLRAMLDGIVQSGLVLQRGSPPSATYQFKHALVQTVAESSLLRARRAEVHQRITNALQGGAAGGESPEILAHHLTEAGVIEEAIPMWERAGSHAAAQFANREAIAHFRRGIGLLDRLTDEATRLRFELSLQLNLAPVYMSTVGFGAPEAERAYMRARDIAVELGDPDQLFVAKWGLWMMNVMRPVKGEGLRIVNDLLELADTNQDAAQRLQARHASWTTKFLMGDFQAARSDAEAGKRIYDASKHASHKFRFGGHDPGICCRNFLSATQVLEGYPDTALSTLRDSLALSETLDHPLSVILTDLFISLVAVLRSEPDLANVHIERAVLIAEKHGVPKAMWSDVYRGWIKSKRGQTREGVATMQRTIDAPGAVGQEPYRCYFLGLIAEACGRDGQPEEGLKHLSSALEIANRDELYWCLPELHRVRGDLLALLSHPVGEVEGCYEEAMEIAVCQNALHWRLRIANSLAHYQASDGRSAEAIDTLAPVYASYSEGFDTIDLITAKSLLGDLS